MKRLIKAEVVGKARYDFTTKEGQRYTGSTLYVMYERSEIEGMACGKVSSPDYLGPVSIGDTVCVLDGVKLELVTGDA